MPATDAVHLKHALLQDTQTGLWKDLTESYWRSSAGKRTQADIEHYGPTIRNDYMAETYPDADSYRKRLFSDIQFSDNYYVSPEMCVLVTAAAEVMPDDEEAKPEDFPTAGGWLLIPNGLVQTDIRGNAVVTNVVVWNTVGGRIRLTYLTDKFHPLDRANTTAGLRAAAEEDSGIDADRWVRQTWDKMPRLTVWHSMEHGFHERMPQTVSLGAVIPPEISNRITVSGNGEDRIITWPVGYTPDQLRDIINPSLHVEPVFRWVLACLRLMQQDLTTVTDQGIPANMRRSLKGKVRMKNTHVSVIEYRRRSASMPGEGTREYTHRFLRRGHWRRQPYKTEDGEWDRKRIWIHPTLVGDPALPLLLREHVKALVR